MNIINDKGLITKLMKNRHSSRDFDPNFKIPRTDLDLIIEAIRMTPSSYGLLNYRILIFPKSPLREEMDEGFYNQKNFSNSSVAMIFIADNGSKLENTTIYQTADMIFPNVQDKEKKEKFILNFHQNFNLRYWNEPRLSTNYSCNQVYIALGVATVAAANLDIDTCIIGGFDEQKITAFLEKNQLISDEEVVTIAMVFGKSKVSNKRKIRRSPDEFVFFVE